jgi:hypothetical protein
MATVGGGVFKSLAGDLGNRRDIFSSALVQFLARARAMPNVAFSSVRPKWQAGRGAVSGESHTLDTRVRAIGGNHDWGAFETEGLGMGKQKPAIPV